MYHFGQTVERVPSAKMPFGNALEGKMSPFGDKISLAFQGERGASDLVNSGLFAIQAPENSVRVKSNTYSILWPLEASPLHHTA